MKTVYHDVLDLIEILLRPIASDKSACNSPCFDNGDYPIHIASSYFGVLHEVLEMLLSV